jgi:hypothetical protein
MHPGVGGFTVGIIHSDRFMITYDDMQPFWTLVQYVSDSNSIKPKECLPNRRTTQKGRSIVLLIIVRI